MSTTLLYLTPFTLSVLNVAIMLTLLMLFLLRIPAKSPATRSLLLFLLGVDMVFFCFIYIFSSLDLPNVTRAWWLLHGVIFFILFLVRFAYHYPMPHFEEERRRMERGFFLLATLVYAGYLYHTTLLQPIFAPGGYLFVFLGTPEIGIAIGAMLAWSMVVFWRTTRLTAASSATMEQITPRQLSAIRKMVLVLLSPVVLLTFIILAYQGLASWELVGHLLGSGVMLFLFLFTVIYLNNSVEPTTLLVKVVGLSLGAILLLLGSASSLTMTIYKQAFLEQREVEISRLLPLPDNLATTSLPADIAYVMSDGALLYTQGQPAPALDGKTTPWQAGWQFREGAGIQPEQFYITHRREVAGHHYEVGYSYLLYRHHIHQMAKPLAWLAIGAALFVLVVFPLFFRLSLFNPLRRLLDGVAAVDAGRLDIEVAVATHDEIGRLTHSFNHMTGSVRESREQLRSAFDYQRDLTEAYSRFVPKEILTTLNKQTILELGLGDSVQKEMTILFSDIRAFTTLSEQMSPSEVFEFINRYLERVGPVVRKHGGYIDKYIGDAVMALFPNGAAPAVAAAIEMQEQVRRFNAECASGQLLLPGLDPHAVTIRIGVGIHTGELMLGTIGEKERMEGTVISDAVNLASRLEGLTKLYDAPILISHGTYSKLDSELLYTVRVLDRVRVRGKSEWVDLYEVIDGENSQRREMKLATLHDFERGVAAFRAARFADARLQFQRLCNSGKDDQAATLYLERCQAFMRQSPPADWDGAITLS